ncbi:MAG: flagellar basal body P-ring protein FlgI [Planctomycetaceae bacterium]|nr:flagellar basal body P-ring protein FlgI [Planctomycetaceae bacterium]
MPLPQQGTTPAPRYLPNQGPAYGPGYGAEYGAGRGGGFGGYGAGLGSPGFRGYGPDAAAYPQGYPQTPPPTYRQTQPHPGAAADATRTGTGQSRRSPVVQVRVKDITTLAGEHANQLVGYGLVTGLNGTGGSSESTKRLAILMLQELGLRADPATRALIQQSQEKTDNISVVMVTASLPPHARIGQAIDVTVSAFDDAESLNGGVLISTPLTGVDGEVYALAAGPISTNGGSFGGQAGNVTKNHPTTGRIANGATVEAEVPSTIFQDGQFQLLLRQPEFETATRIADAINRQYPFSALVDSPAVIRVRLQGPPGDEYRFVSQCRNLMIEPDAVARVVINERTGTIVIGDNVKLTRAAIAHGNIIVSTSEQPLPSQPAPFSQGETVVVPRTEIDVTEEGAMINVIDNTVTVGDLAASLNALGVTPRDLSSIFQMLKASGDLHAELVFQ